MTIRAALVLVVALVGLATAGPVSSAAAAPSDPAYPPHTCPTLSVSTTHPAVGEQITVSGLRFDPHQRVTLLLTPPTRELRTVTTAADGSFSTQVRMPPGARGNKLITVKGGQSVCPADPIQILVQNRTPDNGGAGGPGGTPAMTGMDIGGLLIAAAALIGLGVLLNRRRSGPRRRRPSRS